MELYSLVRDHQGPDPKIDLDCPASECLLVNPASHDLRQMTRDKLKIALYLVLILESAESRQTTEIGCNCRWSALIKGNGLPDAPGDGTSGLEDNFLWVKIISISEGVGNEAELAKALGVDANVIRL